MILNQKMRILLVIAGFVIVIGGRLSIFIGAKNNKEQTLQANIQSIQQKDIVINTAGLRPAQNENNQPKEELFIESKKEEQTPDTITVLIPPMSSLNDRELLSDEIEKNTLIKAKFKHYPTWYQYRAAVAIYHVNPGKIDAILLPSDWYDSFSSRGAKYAIPQELQRIVHPAFTQRLGQKDITIIPYGIDPLVLVSNETSTTQTPTLQDIFKFLATHPQSKTYIPFGFGVDTTDSATIDSKRESIPGLNTILPVLIQQAVNTTRADWLLLLVNNTQRSSQGFQTLSASIDTVHPGCIGSPTLCLLLTKTSSYGISFLSEFNQWKETKTQLKTSDLSVHQLPGQRTQSYPIRGRGFVVNKESSKTKSTRRRLQGYLTELFNENVPYPQYLFSASLSTLQRQIIKEQLYQLSPITQSQNLITGTLLNQESIIYSSDFNKLLNDTIDKKTFLYRISK